MSNNKIQAAVQQSKPEAKAQQSVNTMLNGILDGEKMRRRFDELLGKRTPQFLSSLVSMINDNPDLQAAFYANSMSVIKSALQAASYDLPIDPSLGYAYIVPYKNKGKPTATFIIGYKGMVQLCLRTGAYKCVPDAVDVREGELVSYNRLTGEAVFNWIEDEDERENLPVVGYAGYFQLKNGAEKTIFMTVKQIEKHEQKNRKGEYKGKGWRENFDAMARKTVIRRLCSKYALMSIEYQDNADRNTMNLATALATNDFPEDTVELSGGEDLIVDENTGEVTDPAALPEPGQQEHVPVMYSQAEYAGEMPDFMKGEENNEHAAI
ncbi:MAG: recombinase RecT [Oscillospiraceae bacterium]|nr:recombinase RecT [Oscillospiraceae bacterium]